MSEALGFYTYLNQGQVWIPNGKPKLPITSMGARWRRNAARWLERHAPVLHVYYVLGEIEAVSRLLGDGRGGLPQALDEALSESVLDGWDEAINERFADLAGWIRSTPLYRALVTAPCCQGTGFADYAAIPCPARDCPFPQPGTPPERSPGWGVVLDGQAVTS